MTHSEASSAWQLRRIAWNLPTRCPACSSPWPIPSFGADWWLWRCAIPACGRTFVHGA